MGEWGQENASGHVNLSKKASWGNRQMRGGGGRERCREERGG